MADIIPVLGDYNAIKFHADETSDAVEMTLKYSTDDWDLIDDPTDPTRRGIKELEAHLKRLQIGKYQGKSIRYGRVDEPTPLCDLSFITVTITLADIEDIGTLISRLNDSPLNIAEEDKYELTELFQKYGKRKKKSRFFSTPTKAKHRWAL